MATDDQTRLELEAAVYRRLVAHLRARTDVQNIDLMNLAGFCRNCLSNWMKDAADQKGVAMTKDESREIVYGMPYDEWRAKYQKESSPAQRAAFEKASQKHSAFTVVDRSLCSTVDEHVRALTAPNVTSKASANNERASGVGDLAGTFVRRRL